MSAANNASKLLLDEKPLVILPGLACEIGLNQAIFLQQVHYWLLGAEKSKAAEKLRNDFWWTYGSYEDWKENAFPFWSVSTIKRIVYRLEKTGHLITEEEINLDYPGGARKWYRIDYSKLNRGYVQIEHRVGSEWNEGSGQNDTSNNIDTQNSSETPTDTLPVLEKQHGGGGDVKPDLPKPVQPHIAIIDAWYDGMPAAPIKRKYPRNAQIAARILTAGYTPEQVKAFVVDKYRDPWWSGKSLSLEHVENELPLWLKKRSKPSESSTDTSLSEDQMAALRREQFTMPDVLKGTMQS